MEHIEKFALKNETKIAIGLEYKIENIERMKKIVSNFYGHPKIKIILISDGTSKIPNNYFPQEIEVLASENVVNTMIDLLKENKIDALIRGMVSSSTFLEMVKKILKLNTLSRIALLETAFNKDFLFAPVGIDEGRSIDEKIYFIKNGYKILKDFGIEPAISLLSGGRIGDLGRDKIVDKSINETTLIVNRMKDENIENISHSEILIEEAIKQSNFIIAPDGISGNLIYRTLVHLGNGFSHGALYIEPYTMGKIIIDTSRVGPENEYKSAILMAAAFKNLL